MKDTFIKPINNRIKEQPLQPQIPMFRAIQCVLPVAIYYYLSMVLTYAAAYLIGTGQYGAKTSEMFSERPTLIALFVRIAVLLLSVFPMLRSFAAEKPIIIQSASTGGKDKPIYIIYTIFLSLCLALFLNVIFSKIGISGMSSYGETAAKQFSLSLSAGLLLYGIVTPIAEEIVYRGLVYNRLRRYFMMPIPLFVAPLLFGIAHGNVVQLFYGFIMGVAICYVYERYGSFIYPVIFHIVANSIVYVVIKIEPLKEVVFSTIAMVIMAIASLVLFVLISLEEERTFDIHNNKY